METTKYQNAHWTKFARNHRIKRIILGSYVVAYIVITAGLLIAQKWIEVPLLQGKLGAALNLFFGIGGQMFGIVFAVMLFGNAHNRWVRELGNIFGNPGRPHRFSRYGFYQFAFWNDPVGELHELALMREDELSLRREKARYEQDLKSEERKLERLELQERLLSLAGKFREGSPEAKRIERAALSNSITVASLNQVIAEMESKEPHTEAPPPPAAARDKIAELEADYRDAVAGIEPDTAAERLFQQAGTCADRKQKRSLLVQAISLQRAANKKRAEQESRARALRKPSTA